MNSPVEYAITIRNLILRIPMVRIVTFFMVITICYQKMWNPMV